jgi:putative tryptophan/tyrosine transport system substrate-binding protein
MRRRELMLLLGGAMAATRGVGAQQKAMPVIGFLGSGSPSPIVAAFNEGLSKTGYVEGQDVAIEYRWAEGRYDRLPALAADLVGRNVDVIAAITTASALAAKTATSTIPIVFTGVGDPVGAGLVASLARPGGNLTGFSNSAAELNAKRLELLSELVPQAKIIALLVNPNNQPNTERIIGDVEEAARAKGAQVPIPEGRHRRRDRCRLRNPRRTACRRAICRRRSVLLQPMRAAPGAGIAPCASSELYVARVCGGIHGASLRRPAA